MGPTGCVQQYKCCRNIIFGKMISSTSSEAQGVWDIQLFWAHSLKALQLMGPGIHVPRWPRWAPWHRCLWRVVCGEPGAVWNLLAAGHKGLVVWHQKKHHADVWKLVCNKSYSIVNKMSIINNYYCTCCECASGFPSSAASHASSPTKVRQSPCNRGRVSHRPSPKALGEIPQTEFLGTLKLLVDSNWSSLLDVTLFHLLAQNATTSSPWSVVLGFVHLRSLWIIRIALFACGSRDIFWGILRLAKASIQIQLLARREWSSKSEVNTSPPGVSCWQLRPLGLQSKKIERV